MSRFGCVTPSEGLDVTDRKACFLSLLAQAPVWLLELRVSQHFTVHLFRPWIPSSARDIDGEPRRSTEVVLNEQSLPVADSGRVGKPRPNERNKSDRKENTRQPRLRSMPGPPRSNRKSEPFLSGKKQASGTVLLRRGES